jgi:hypothetical protein
VNQLSRLDVLPAGNALVAFFSYLSSLLVLPLVPEALTELCSVIQDVTISMEEIIVGGGGESKGTQQLG